MGEYVPAIYGWGALWGDGIYYQPWMAEAIYGGMVYTTSHIWLGRSMEKIVIR